MTQIDALTVSTIIAKVDHARAAQYCKKCSGKNPNCHAGQSEHYSGWMAAICHDLAAHFAAPGLAAFSNFKTVGTEFLLDFVLLESELGNGSPKNITRTILGMEVEWDVKVSDAGSERDFNKLMCFNSPLKVFVYSCRAQDQPSFKSSIEQRLRQFSNHREGDEYLIVEFSWQGEAWCPEAKRFQIQNGQVGVGQVLS